MVAVPLAVDEGDTLPHGEVLHVTVQVTPLLAESFVTVAVNWAVPPACTLAELGETETEITG